MKKSKRAAEIAEYAEKAEPELLDFIRRLAPIPAPSGKEDRRVAFLVDAFAQFGFQGVFVDDAKNVIFPYRVETDKDVTVLMAHTDVVFPDETPLPYSEDDDVIRCPGIGDDTARLALNIFAMRWLVAQGLAPEGGIVFVANSCEEGLGNLKGSRAICERYAGRIRAFVSNDDNTGHAVNRAVGSVRRRVVVETAGGHSWANFGAKNAIAVAAGLIHAFYQVKPPRVAGERTTYNVGLVSGGTSVNTIAQRAEFLYEVRSTDPDCLTALDRTFRGILARSEGPEVSLSVSTVGERPCGRPRDAAAQWALEKMAARALRETLGLKMSFCAGSTDANIPLSQGIPALTIGSGLSHGAHTRGEWLEKASLVPALKFLCAFYALF